MEMFYTHIDPEVEENLRRVLRSRRLSEGVWVANFEQQLASQLGLANPVAVNSGTSALYLALRLAGVGPGDRVILPAITFIATAAAILQCGAVPVFADVDPETGNIDPESVKEILQSYDGPVGAVIPVHWLGLPANLEGLADVLGNDWRSLYCIEDAAHALGAIYHNHPIGDCWESDYACFSFQATKHLTTGDGGVVCPFSYHDSFRAKKLRWFGIDRSFPVGPLGEREFELKEVGGKYHMNDIAAAIGLGNLESFAERLARRRAINSWLRLGLAMVDGVKLLASPPDRESACYAFGLRVQRRVDFARAMQDRGIPCSVIASRIDKYEFPAVRRPLPGTDVFDSEFIAMPCHEDLSGEDVNQIIRAVKDGW